MIDSCLKILYFHVKRDSYAFLLYRKSSAIKLKIACYAFSTISPFVAVSGCQKSTAFETCPSFTLFAFLILIVNHCTSTRAVPIKVQGVNSFGIIMHYRNIKQYDAVQKNLSLSFYCFPRLSFCHLVCQELLNQTNMMY